MYRAALLLTLTSASAPQPFELEEQTGLLQVKQTAGASSTGLSTYRERLVIALKARETAAEQTLLVEQAGAAELEKQLFTAKAQLKEVLAEGAKSQEQKEKELELQEQQVIGKAKVEAEAEVKQVRAQAQAEVAKMQQLAQLAVKQTRTKFQGEVTRAQASEAQALSTVNRVRREAAKEVALARQQVASEVQSAQDSVARVERMMQGWSRSPSATASDGAQVSDNGAQLSGVPAAAANAQVSDRGAAGGASLGMAGTANAPALG